jgi:hypothetical protein
MSEKSDTARHAPTVFVIPEEAHLELIKLREHLRLMTRLVEPGSGALHACLLHPHALSFWFTTFWRTVDEYLQATYWSGDHAVDLEEAHARAAALRERSEELRGAAEQEAEAR